MDKLFSLLNMSPLHSYSPLTEYLLLSSLLESQRNVSQPQSYRAEAAFIEIDTRSPFQLFHFIRLR